MKPPQRGSWEGRGSTLIHYVLQADQSASLCKLPHKLLWTWFRGMEEEKAIIPQIKEYRKGCGGGLQFAFYWDIPFILVIPSDD